MTSMTDLLRPTREIHFENQKSDGSVRIARVEMAEPGFVAVHDYRFWDGMGAESSLGATYLDTGVHEDVVVDLEQPLTESQFLLAVRHRDDPADGAYRWADTGGSEDPVSPDTFGATGEIGILGHARVAPERD